jgi:hypothetical protein
LLIVDAVTGNQRMGTLSAQRTGRIGLAAPHGFHLMVPETTQEYLFVATFKLSQSFAQSVLGPALRIRFFRIGEEAIEGSEHIGYEIEQARLLSQTRGFSHDIIVAAG